MLNREGVGWEGVGAARQYGNSKNHKSAHRSIDQLCIYAV